MITFRLSVGLILFSVFLYGEGHQVSKHVHYHQYFYGAAGTKAMLAILKNMETKLAALEKVCGKGAAINCPKVPKNCVEVLKRGGKTSGVYTVDPDGLGPFQVYCDQKTSGGGWTVFQKRQDGSVNFYRGWAHYKTGFGNLKGEFWLGLDKINRLTHQKRNRLRVELEDTKGNRRYAEYDYFAVSNEKNKYRLSLGTYSGNAGDSLSYHRGAFFSTKDRHNNKYRGNCAVRHKGAWWYKACHSSNLNGLYHNGVYSSNADGVSWYRWKGHYYSYKRAEMKIRPVGFKTG